MARPRKWRRVCAMPENEVFGPLNGSVDPDFSVTMSIDEYEAIRLIDLEGMNQNECAEQMQIARTTVQGMYNTARKKLAESLVEGKVLRIEGGTYQLCSDAAGFCGRGACQRHRRGAGHNRAER